MKENDLIPVLCTLMIESRMFGILAVNNGEVVWCNSGILELLEYENTDAVVGKDANILFSGTNFFDRIFEEECLNRIVDPEEIVNSFSCNEVFFLNSQGIPVGCRAFFYHVSKSELGENVVLIFVQDVDEYSKIVSAHERTVMDLEEAKLVQEEQSEQLASLLIKMEEAEKVKLEKEKLSGVLEMAVATAHEISQPLQNALYDISFLKDAMPDDEEVQDALKSLEDAVNRTGEVLEKIRKTTEYKSTDYGGGVKMVDIS